MIFKLFCAKSVMAAELEQIDRTILFELSKDAGQSLSEIAKKIRRSVPTAEYRIGKLMERKMIRSFLTLIDYKRLGYTNYFIYWTLRNMNAKKEGALIADLAKDENVNAVFRWDGTWNISVGILARDVFELSGIVARIKERFSANIDKEAFTVHLGAHHFGRNYLVSEKERPVMEITPITGGKVESVEIDKVESRILRTIRSGARLPTVEIAEKTGLTPDIVRYRMKRLRKEGVIVGASVLFDYSNFYPMYRVLLSTRGMTAKKEHELFAFLGQRKNIFRAMKTFGAYDIAIDAEFERVEDFRAFLFELKDKFSDLITHHETLSAVSADKSGYFLG